MQRNGKDSSVGWKIASIAFRVAPSIGWRLHMSKIAAEIRPPMSVPSPHRRRKSPRGHEANLVEVMI
jgi:hypothetical protein